MIDLSTPQWNILIPVGFTLFLLFMGSLLLWTTLAGRDDHSQDIQHDDPDGGE